MKTYLFLAAFLLSGCFSSDDAQNIEHIEIQTIAKEVQIPKILMTELESEVMAESKTVAPVYLFMPLKVQFTELSDGALSHPKIVFHLPKGGGNIDLKDIVTGLGSFYMSFPSDQFENLSEFKPDLLHLYFISNSPIKKIDNEKFGLGCGKMIDLKKSFSKLQDSSFLKLNTSELRYLHVMAGRYVFIFKQSTKVYMAQLTLTDSRHYKELCLGGDF